MGIAAIDNIPIDATQFSDVILKELTDAVYVIDRQRRILYWNAAAERLTGYSAGQVLGSSCADGILMHVDDRGTELCKEGCPLAAICEDGQSRDAHVFMHHADGHRVPVHVRGAAVHDHAGSIIGAVEVFTDDTERVGVLERLRDMEQAALLDELTGLANRRYFNRAFAACLASYTRNETPFGLVLMDIDHFKRFNDTHGHDVGDAALRMVARTLGSSCRPYDMPVRWGGEEFALLLNRVDHDLLLAVAERMRVLVAGSSLDVDGTPVGVTVSVGASLVRPGDNAESILHRADVYLYESKHAGRNLTTADPVG